MMPIMRRWKNASKQPPHGAGREARMIGKLIFNNAETVPKSIMIECDEASVSHIMAWYGAYHSGDRYTATWNARNVPMNCNGELISSLNMGNEK